MAKFVIGRPITTTVPEVLVDAGLPDGRHRFRLVVVDDSGNTSRPDEIVLSITRVALPTGTGVGTTLPGGVLTTVPVRPPVAPPVLTPVQPVVNPVLPLRPPRGRNRRDP